MIILKQPEGEVTTYQLTSRRTGRSLDIDGSTYMLLLFTSVIAIEDVESVLMHPKMLMKSLDVVTFNTPITGTITARLAAA